MDLAAHYVKSTTYRCQDTTYCYQPGGHTRTVDFSIADYNNLDQVRPNTSKITVWILYMTQASLVRIPTQSQT